MITEMRPQPKQVEFLKSNADITIYGGSAGGGKTWSLLVDPLKHIHLPGFGAVAFRRTIPEITRQGGLWDESAGIYPLFKGVPNLSSHSWTFPAGSRVTFAGLQYEQDLESWRGAQIAALYFDQLETFSRSQFFYMASRNRSTCGVRPYIRATCNPEPGWLAEFLEWWIAPDGYADPARAGKTRYFIQTDDMIQWADTPDELTAVQPGARPKSCTFIPATIYDNQELLRKNPEYLASLQGLSRVDRERLLGDAERGGNWKIKPEAGNVFNRAWFEVVPDWDKNGVLRAGIYWDFAATAQSVKSADPDYTAWAVAVFDAAAGKTIFLECGQKRLPPAAVYDEFETRCRYWWEYFSDLGIPLSVRWEIEPGSASKREARTFAALIPYADARGIPSTANKLVRARPLAAQAEHGNVSILRGAWNEEWLNHMHAQPAAHDDMMDAATGVYAALTNDAGRKTAARSYGG